jgi:hypothetical protein
VIEGGRQWYEIWVPQDPDGWAAPKLVFRDISEHPMFWMDLDGSVVNGDCYWLSLHPGASVDLLWLTVAVANSAFIEEFYDLQYNNKLYAGRRRFITQYVDNFPLPDPTTKTSQQLVELARSMYDSLACSTAVELQKDLDIIVRESFGVSDKKDAGSGNGRSLFQYWDSREGSILPCPPSSDHCS